MWERENPFCSGVSTHDSSLEFPCFSWFSQVTSVWCFSCSLCQRLTDLMARYLFTITHDIYKVVNSAIVTLCKSVDTSLSSHVFLFWMGCSWFLCYSKCPLESLLKSVVVGDTERSPGRPLRGACFLAGSNTWPEVSLVASLSPVRRKPVRKDWM